jgi:hypothetical protein
LFIYLQELFTKESAGLAQLQSKVFTLLCSSLSNAQVLKTDTFSQVKKNEFIREVEIMSSPQMRHPNLVLLLGACVQNVEKWAMITGIHSIISFSFSYPRIYE